MWILTLFPYWVFDLVLLLGITGLALGYFLRLIPLQLGALLLTVLGVWFNGGIANDEQWEAKVAELEKRALTAEAKSAETNTQVVTKTVKEIQTIRERGAEVVKYIDRVVVQDQEVVKFVETCEIPSAIINLHNEAAK